MARCIDCHGAAGHYYTIEIPWVIELKCIPRQESELITGGRWRFLLTDLASWIPCDRQAGINDAHVLKSRLFNYNGYGIFWFCQSSPLDSFDLISITLNLWVRISQKCGCSISRNQ